MYKSKRNVIENKGDKPRRSTRGAAKKQPKARQTEFTRACSNFAAQRYKNPENPSSKRRRITTERVTVPLGFFNEGVKSKMVRKNTRGGALNQQSCNFLNEDLHALLQSVSATGTKVTPSPQYTNLRRSKRISAQSPDVRTHYESIADYYMQQSEQEEVLNDSQKEYTVNDTASGANSLFKEINSRYQKVSANKENTSNSRLTTTLNVSREPFCKHLEEQLAAVTLNSRKARCIGNIKTLVAEIDDALEGKRAACLPVEPQTRPQVTENVLSVTSQLIPKPNWSYETPGNQKLKRPVITSYSNQLKPCFLQTNTYSKVIFELDTTVTDLELFEEHFDTFSFPCNVNVNNETSFNPSNFIESANDNFKLPLAVPPCTETHRNIVSIFDKDVVPLFEETNDCLNIPIQIENKNVRFARRPTKIPKKVIRNHALTPQCLYFRETSKRQKLHELKQANQEFGGFSKKNCSKLSDVVLNYEPQDFSNHPGSSSLHHEEDFIIDEQFQLPVMAQLTEISPLKFYSKKQFGAQ